MRIAIITSSRADYGLLKPLIKKISTDIFFDLKIIATGTHLEPSFGNTYKEIENDGFKIYKKINILVKKDDAQAITKICSNVFLKFGKLYNDLKPDALFVLGDRYEIFCAVNAALFFNIPVMHYSGGEKTEGAIDDSIRHSITKMSHLHFTSCNTYKKRVIQLGEQPKTVFNVGSLGIENIKNTNVLTKNEFEKSINFKLNELFFLISYHPETLSKLSGKQQFTEVLNAISKFKNASVIFTKSNADNDGRVINKMIDEFVAKNKNCIAFESLGLLRYLSAINLCNIVIGNSSSGITEVPFFNKPTVNIGNRQKGRLMSKSIINCKIEKSDIEKSISKGLNPNFSKQLKNIKPLFGNGTASKQIVEIIKKVKVNTTKSFYDLKIKT